MSTFDSPEPVMRPNQATSSHELLVALINSTDELPTVNIAVLVGALGLEEARKLTVIQTHAFVDRTRAIEMLMLNRAVGMLSAVDRLSLNPFSSVETVNANHSKVDEGTTRQGF